MKQQRVDKVARLPCMPAFECTTSTRVRTRVLECEYSILEHTRVLRTRERDNGTQLHTRSMPERNPETLKQPDKRMETNI